MAIETSERVRYDHPKLGELRVRMTGNGRGWFVAHQTQPHCWAKFKKLPTVPSEEECRENLRTWAEKHGIEPIRELDAVTPAEDYSVRNNVDGSYQLLLKLDWLEPNPLNPRRAFDEPSLRELAESIKAHGLIEPIVVRIRQPLRTMQAKGVCYSIVCGERRWRAARLAGLTEIPARILNDIDDRQALELALVENLQRKDLDPIEEAQGYQKLMELGWKQAEIAEKVNRSQGTISNAVRLLKLPEKIQDSISKGKLSASHGEALATWVDYPEVLEYQHGRAKSGATSREIEDLGPGYHNLASKGVLKPMYDCVFNSQAECGNCPHYRPRGTYPMCLDPSCYAQKQTTLAAVRFEQQKEELGVAADDSIVNLEGLSHNDYGCLWESKAPKACKADCPNRKRAIAKYAEDLVEACMNPECYRELTAADQKEVAAARQKAIKEKREALEERITQDVRDGNLSKLAAMACLPALNARDGKALAKTIRELGLELDADRFALDRWAENGMTDEGKVDELSKLPAFTIVLLTAKAMFRDELAAAQVQEWRKAGWTDWYLDLSAAEDGR